MLLPPELCPFLLFLLVMPLPPGFRAMLAVPARAGGADVPSTPRPPVTVSCLEQPPIVLEWPLWPRARVKQDSETMNYKFCHDSETLNPVLSQDTQRSCYKTGQRWFQWRSPPAGTRMWRSS